MAFLSEEDKKKLEGADPAAQQPGAAGGGAVGTSGPAMAGSSVGGAVAGSSGVSPGTAQAMKGSGGQSSWTNIQSYLDANRGNSTTTKLVDNLGSKFADEQANVNKSASDTVGKVQSELSKVNVGRDQASKMVEQGLQAGRGSDAYNQSVNTLKNTLSAQYQGPQNWQYGLPGEVQSLATSLDTKNFQNTLGDLYRKGAGTNLTSGQLNLQRQLDIDPQAAAAIEAARNNALQKYAGLTSAQQAAQADVGRAVADAQRQFTERQNEVRSALSGAQTDAQAGLEELIRQWKGEEARISRGEVKPDGLPSGKMYKRYYRPDDPNAFVDKEVNLGDFNTYRASDVDPTLENIGVGGVGDARRDQFNMISEILGGNRIEAGTANPGHGSWAFDPVAAMNARNAINDEMAGLGYQGWSSWADTLPPPITISGEDPAANAARPGANRREEIAVTTGGGGLRVSGPEAPKPPPKKRDPNIAITYGGGGLRGNGRY